MSGLSISRITATHWYPSRKSRTSPQKRVFLWHHACASVRVCIVSSKSSGLLSRGFGLQPLFSNGTPPGPRFVILWTFLSRARLARWTLHGFPYS